MRDIYGPVSAELPSASLSNTRPALPAGDAPLLQCVVGESAVAHHQRERRVAAHDSTSLLRDVGQVYAQQDRRGTQAEVASGLSVVCFLQLPSGSDEMFLLRLRLEEIGAEFEVLGPQLAFERAHVLCRSATCVTRCDSCALSRHVCVARKVEPVLFWWRLMFCLLLAEIVDGTTAPASANSQALGISVDEKALADLAHLQRVADANDSKVKLLQQQQEFFVIQYQELCKLQGTVCDSTMC